MTTEERITHWNGVKSSAERPITISKKVEVPVGLEWEREVGKTWECWTCDSQGRGRHLGVGERGNLNFWADLRQDIRAGFAVVIKERVLDRKTALGEKIPMKWIKYSEMSSTEYKQTNHHDHFWNAVLPPWICAQAAIGRTQSCSTGTARSLLWHLSSTSLGLAYRGCLAFRDAPAVRVGRGEKVGRVHLKTEVK